ncbi:organomercurial lyase [Actinokineospora sp.]|uniref:organomercurial lyase n=1 Tax=Actinokineospora sp. TaxID=1872133 RepID=UPI003D6A0249
MTRTDTTQAIAELTRPGGTLDLGHDRARLLIRVFHLLLRQAHPVTRTQALDAITELGIDGAWANAQLDAWAEPDDAGDIAGLGLTYNPTPHRMTIDGVRLWAWCGMDTLIFTHVLGKPISIESTAPGSGEIVRLHASPAGVTDLHPADAVVTQRLPSREQIDLDTTAGIWGTFCHHNHFFPNRTQAEQWADGRDDIAILSIEDGFAVARDMAAALTRYEPGARR